MKRIRGQVVAGRPAEPLAFNVRQLACQVLIQALRDARTGEQPWDREAAMAWLNSAEGREIARAFGCRWATRPQSLTFADLPNRIPASYFRGE